MKHVEFVEIDVPVCTLAYGVAPCTAAIGVTGEIKCFNSPGTCQDKANFTPADVTLRFALASAYRPLDIEAAAFLVATDYSPAILSLGESLGQRASLRAVFRDARHSDTGPAGDPYLADRDYDPFAQGTFWGKFRARQPFLRGKKLRWISGLAGQTLAEMETRHFVIDSFDGPTPDGTFSITAKDPLKALDAERALCPAPSKGYLAAALTSAATAATLSPAGIGNSDYPASGLLNIAGKEIVSFTRTADALTLTRAQKNTVAVAHSAQDRLQLCKQWSVEDPASILAELFVDYGGLDAAYVPEATWLVETGAYYGQFLTACVAEPTPVKQLAEEAIDQAGLAVWWDDLNEEIQLRVLREITTDAATFDDTNIIAGGVAAREQLNKRISQVWVYYGQINPLRPLAELANYRSSEIVIDTDAEADYGDVQYKVVVARFIPELGRAVARRTGDIKLGRFRTAPRRASFKTFRRGADVPVLGQGYRIEGNELQEATGARESVPVRITRLKPTARHFEVEAEEDRFVDVSEGDVATRTILYDFDTYNRNLRADHDSLYAAPASATAWSAGTYTIGQIRSHEGDYWIVTAASTTEEPGDAAADWDLYLRIVFQVAAARVIGSLSSSLPSVDVGTWPAGLEPLLVNAGTIAGKPGAGGKGAYYRDNVGSDTIRHGEDGGDGGLALLVEAPIRLDNDTGTIGGGGGGGGGGGARSAGIGTQQGGGGGGSGAGAAPSAAGVKGNSQAKDGAAGNLTDGGIGGNGSGGPGAPAGPFGRKGGDGADPGDDGDAGLVAGGSDANPGDGGAAGDAIDGWSLVTVINTGTILGDTVN